MTEEATEHIVVAADLSMVEITAWSVVAVAPMVLIVDHGPRDNGGEASVGCYDCGGCGRFGGGTHGGGFLRPRLLWSWP